MRRSAAARISRTAVGVLLTAGIVAVPRTCAATSPQHWSADDSSQSGTHATRGVVQAIDPRMMVIARPRGRGTMTFSMTPSTRREGAIVVGSAVSVRYHEDGGSRVATAVALHQRAR